MTYKEFGKEIKRIAKTYDLDLYVDREEKNIFVQLAGVTCVAINKSQTYCLDTIYDAFALLKDSPKYELFVVCSELAQTPIPERKIGQKFYLKHRFLTGYNNESYFNESVSTDLTFLSDEYNKKFMQTEFTQEEIDEIKEKYKTDLKDFEIIEVEE